MKHFLFFFLIAISIQLVAQQEVDEYELQNFSIISPVQSEIKHAIGWSLQDNGKWAYSENRIPYTDSRTNTTRQPAVDALGLENFTSIELRKIMIDEKQYNMLIRKYKDGEFEFDYLAKGWKTL